MTPKLWIAAILFTLTISAQSQPKGRIAGDAPLTQAIHKALPPGATEVQKPLAVILSTLGKVYVVTYRISPDEHAFHGFALVRGSQGYVSRPLSTPEKTANEEVVTSVLAATAPNPDLARPDRLLIILFYTHAQGTPGSQAHGRVYRYDQGSFFLDEARSGKLEGVRTAAVARLRLKEQP